MNEEKKAEGLIMNAAKPVMQARAQNIDDMIRLLDEHVMAGGGRMRLRVIEQDKKTTSFPN